MDKFHFDKNHIGIWCNKFVNPNNVAALDGINTEVCEQRFKHLNKFGPMLRHMKRERFKWTLLSIVEGDHKFRRQGLLGKK